MDSVYFFCPDVIFFYIFFIFKVLMKHISTSKFKLNINFHTFS